MNLHLIHDAVFLNDYIDLLTEAGRDEDNHFYVYLSFSDKKKEYKYLLKEKMNKVKLIELELDQLHLVANSYEKVFIHFMDDKLLDFISKLGKKVKLYWCTWGSDFHCPDEIFYNVLFDPKSKAYFEEELKKPILEFIQKNPAQSFVKKMFYKMAHTFIPEYRIKRALIQQRFEWDKYLKRKADVFKRVDYILNYGIEDYEFVKKHYKINPSYLPFFYTTFKSSEADPGQSNLLKKHNIGNEHKIVFIGNCAEPHNNHLDLLPLLVKLKIQVPNVRFVVPLSYGNKDYTTHICNRYTKELGQNFQPIVDYIDDKEDYYRLLNSIDIMIMNHNINMGGTNLFKAIFYGKKVYAKKNSPLVKHLVRNGVILNYVEDTVNSDLSDFFTPLSNEQVDNNKTAILSVFSSDKARDNLNIVYQN